MNFGKLTLGKEFRLYCLIDEARGFLSDLL
jgi:hypothetical protein